MRMLYYAMPCYAMLVQASGKMQLLDRLMTLLKQQGGHRVLIFSQARAAARSTLPRVHAPPAYTSAPPTRLSRPSHVASHPPTPPSAAPVPYTCRASRR